VNLSKRQIEIIEAATNLIGQGGVKSLTTRALAAEIGFSEPALYRHFSDKNEIVKSVLLYYKDVLRQGLTNVIESNSSGKDKIKAMIDFQFNHFIKFPAVIMVMFSETSFQHDTELSKTVLSIMLQKGKLVTTMIEAGQREGTIRKDIAPDQLAKVIMGSMRLTILKWRLSDFNFDLIQEGKTLWTTIELLIKEE
jgi:TetR/AcrR family fatty acid metabolism transcriptional regulator